MQLLQPGTDEKPSSKTVSQVLLIFSTRLMTKQCLIRNYAFRYANGSLELEVTNSRPLGDSEELSESS
jgi:hypothetical protein